MSPPLEYAAGTEVPVDRTKAELEKLLRRAGASQYGTAHDDAGGTALVYFRLDDRSIRLQIPLPKRDAFKLRANSSWIHAKPADQERRWEQACRTRWRGVLLIVKAKLQLVALGLSTIEREFLADITLPDGRSVGELLRPALAEAYTTGRLPPLLTNGERGDRTT